jgi:hypothetical protein
MMLCNVNMLRMGQGYGTRTPKPGVVRLIARSSRLAHAAGVHQRACSATGAGLA